MAKFDSVNDPKRPLILECRGGPFPSMRVYEHTPTELVPIRDETGTGRFVGQYVLKGSVYEWEVLR
jgi:hypothetical protein